jgi:glycosyltransferase involved in cell wall biosynthesis
MIGGRTVDVSVSVVIPMYDAAPWIGEALASVAGQSRPVHECLVVDDGSTDDGASIVRAFAVSSPCQVRLISIEHAGVSAARNAAIEASTGEFVAFLDADDVWAQDKIERQVAAMQRSDAVMCTTGCAMFDTETRRVSGIFSNDRASARHPDRAIRRWLALEGNGLAIGSTALVRRAALDQVKEFDTRVSVCEDLELAVRLLEVGSILIDREVLVGYRQHSSQAHRELDAIASNTSALYGVLSFDGFGRSFENRCLANLDAHLGYSLLVRGRVVDGSRLLLRVVRRDPRRLVTLPLYAVTRRLARRWRAMLRRSSWPVIPDPSPCR